MEETPSFRQPKRRKFVRRHSASDDENGQTAKQASPGDEGMVPSKEKASMSVSEIMKRRNQARSKGVGAKFTNSKGSVAEAEDEENALALIDHGTAKLKAMSDRFVGHSEQVVDADKYMMAYVDLEMAKRRATTTSLHPLSNRPTHHDASSHSDSASSTPTSSPHLRSPNTAPIGPPQARNPASLGQLQEVDLGPAAHQRAITLTSAALARQSNPPASVPTDYTARKPRKPRLDRDGKPLRPRPRPRRPSADIARDALVDQILNEHRPDNPYDDLPSSSAIATTASPRAGDEYDEDADERLASQFRQDFLDALASRQQQQQAAQQQPSHHLQKGKAAAGEVGQKGPRLGGSRSARAAMAQTMREKELGKK